MQSIISAQGLGKKYQIGQNRDAYGSLRDSIVAGARVPLDRLRGIKRSESSVWALRDVSFEVEQGDVVGLIGRNGAGKSTLLKLLARITSPSAGRAEITGRVASLLEVGTGFHPELTGRENIFLNGAILGMKKTEITRKFDEIVAFSEVEKYLDTPVKRYSSGMFMRLAFAVAAHLEPEILLVDEVLAVGDLAFQKKCMGKMGEVARNGRTIFFVSHNLGSISTLCNRAIYLAGGTVKQMGPVDEVVHKFVGEMMENRIEDLDLLRTPGKGTQIRFLDLRLVGPEDTVGGVRSDPARDQLLADAVRPDLLDLVHAAIDLPGLLVRHPGQLRQPGDHTAIIDLDHELREAEGAHRVRDGGDRLRVGQHRGAAHGIDVALVELAETPALGTIAAPDRGDVVTLERQDEIVGVQRRHARQRHRQVVAQPDLAPALIGEAIEEFFVLAVLPGERRGVFECRGVERLVAVALEDLAQDPHHLLPQEHLGREEIAEAAEQLRLDQRPPLAAGRRVGLAARLHGPSTRLSRQRPLPVSGEPTGHRHSIAASLGPIAASRASAPDHTRTSDHSGAPRPPPTVRSARSPLTRRRRPRRRRSSPRPRC